MRKGKVDKTAPPPAPADSQYSKLVMVPAEDEEETDLQLRQLSAIMETLNMYGKRFEGGVRLQFDGVTDVTAIIYGVVGSVTPFTIEVCGNPTTRQILGNLQTTFGVSAEYMVITSNNEKSPDDFLWTKSASATNVVHSFYIELPSDFPLPSP